MSRRVVRADVEARLVVLSRMMGVPLCLDSMAHGYRVELADGSRQLSPRLTLRDVYDWMDAGVTVLAEVERSRSTT